MDITASDQCHRRINRLPAYLLTCDARWKRYWAVVDDVEWNSGRSLGFCGWWSVIVSSWLGSAANGIRLAGPSRVMSPPPPHRPSSVPPAHGQPAARAQHRPAPASTGQHRPASASIRLYLRTARGILPQHPLPLLHSVSDPSPLWETASGDVFRSAVAAWWAVGGCCRGAEW